MRKGIILPHRTQAVCLIASIRLETINHVANRALKGGFRYSTSEEGAGKVRAMHQLPVITALLISLVLGLTTTALVAQREPPPGPAFVVF